MPNPERRKRCLPPCIYVELAWGDTVLRAEHLCPPRDFVLGPELCGVSAPGASAAVDPAPVLLVGPGIALRAVVPRGAEVRLEIPGLGALNQQQALERGVLCPCPDVEGALQAWLLPGMCVRTRLGHGDASSSPYRRQNAADDALYVTVHWVEGAEWHGLRAPRLPGWRVLTGTAATAALHACLFAWIAYAMPAMQDTWLKAPEREPQLMGLGPAVAWADAEEEPDRDAAMLDDESLSGPTVCGAELAVMGRPKAARAHKRYAVAGPKDNPDPHLARQRGPWQWPDFSIGWQDRGYGAPEQVFVTPWGRDDSLGQDGEDARGRLMEVKIGEANGFDGLGRYGSVNAGVPPRIRAPQPPPLCEGDSRTAAPTQAEARRLLACYEQVRTAPGPQTAERAMEDCITRVFDRRQ